MPPKRELKLPSQLLDRIGGEGFDDNQWRESHNFGKKRKSRKETRKDLRQSKKQKNGRHSFNSTQPEQPKSNNAPAKPEKRKKEKVPVTEKKPMKSDKVLRPFVSAHDEEVRRKDEEDAKYYAKKLGLKDLKLKDGEDDGLEDILGDLDFDNFSENGDNSEIESNLENDQDASGQSEDDFNDAFDDDAFEDGGDDDDDDDDEGETMTAEETMARLAALKKNKSNSNQNADVRVVKEDELDDEHDSEGFDDSDEEEEEEDSDGGMTAEETMAKLAALKARKAKSSAPTKSSSAKLDASNLAADDDSLSEGDFDGFDEDDEDDDEDENEGSMTAEETMAKLAELKRNKASSKSSNEVNDFNEDEEDEEEDSELESESDSDGDDENPYVPPKLRNAPSVDASIEDKPKEDSEAVKAMRRSFKGALNKLTESTLPHVTNEIELVFMKNSRAEASEVLTEQLLELVDGPQPLQHTLYTVYAGLIAALYQSIGIGFAAHLVQVTVERIVGNFDQASNLLSLLVEGYSLHVVSSRLPYDLMKHFLGAIDSVDKLTPVELLLVIIRNGGSQLRSDDPIALKEVIVLLQQRMQRLGEVGQLSPRMRFLVDSIVALKNNRQKPVSEIVVALRHRIRKLLQNSVNSKSSESMKEPLQVGLGDILDSKTRGKWWLVGASWKGNSGSTSGSYEDNDKIDIDMDDEFGASTPDWLELAKKQRLNTDVRRAIFVALMGAEDYLDACLRIDKLGLKNKQERDVPHVILHCLNQEPFYNPYYSLVAGKQCTRHSTMKTFQFRLWDWLNSEPRGNPQTAMHYGRFFASLVGQGVMPLDVLKMADFLGGSSDIQIFLQFFCVSLYKEVARQAEKLAKQTAHRGLVHIPGVTDIDRDGKEVALMLSKVREPTVLRGLQIINKTLGRSEAIQSEKDRKRVGWVAQFTTDLIEELVRKTD